MGMDIVAQPRYCGDDFGKIDVTNIRNENWWGFDLIWASPPCQQFCRLRTREDLSGYPDLIDFTRTLLARQGEGGTLTIIENVPDAPIQRDLMLCGAMFGLRSYRHRHFECSFPIAQPDHPKHTIRVNRRGENRREHWANGGFITITGDVGTYCGPEAMGIDWMSGDEMSEAIPPAYSEYIGRAAIQHIAITRTYEAAEWTA